MYGCHSDNQAKIVLKNVSFFTFPKNKKMALEWVKLCKRKDKFNIVNARICSKHFTQEDYVRNLKHELLQYNAKNYRSLKREAVPSQNLPQLLKRVRMQENSSRDERQKKGKERSLWILFYSSKSKYNDYETCIVCNYYFNLLRNKNESLASCSGVEVTQEVTGNRWDEGCTNRSGEGENSQHALIPAAMKNIG